MFPISAFDVGELSESSWDKCDKPSLLKCRVLFGFDELSGFDFGTSHGILVNNEQPLMQLLVLFKSCRDQMRGDREECGVY
jgi:hypothetical protein